MVKKVILEIIVGVCYEIRENVVISLFSYGRGGSIICSFFRRPVVLYRMFLVV